LGDGLHPVHFVAGRTQHSGAKVQNKSTSTGVAKTRSPRPDTAPDWATENKVLRFDRDTVQRFDLKVARLITYLECWLSGKVKRDPGSLQYTYDSAQVIGQRTGLKSATLERIVKKLRAAKFIRVKHGKKNVRHYAFGDQKGYFESRAKEKHRFALREDADKHGEPVAILLYNLRHWTKYNKERIRLFKGRYWRYDWINNLADQFTGILTTEQIRDALRYMRKKHLMDMIAYYDANGVRQDDRYWITLLEVPPVDDYEPENQVRPASMFTRDGVRIDVGAGHEKCQISDDKTASPNDKTGLPNDKTESGVNGHQPTQLNGVTGNGHSPLIETSLFVPPEVAEAPSVTTQLRVSANLQQSAEPARPLASRKPSASSADSPTTGDSGAFGNLRLEELGAEVENMKRHLQQLNLSIHLGKTKPMNRDGWLESQVDMLLRIPRSSQRNFLNQFSRDTENARKEQSNASSPVDRLQLAEEFRQISMKKIPRDCFSHQYGDPRKPCKTCVWAKSCEIATPVEIIEAIRCVSIVNTPKWDVLRESDQPDNVADTYRSAYREVFGMEAPDTVGKSSAIYHYAQLLKIPVLHYCLVYMSQWANTHPLQKFYANYLSGDNAFEFVNMVLDLCNQRYGAVLEDRLAMVLHLKFVGGQPLWRHQPTPAERFMDGWQEACKENGQPDYQFHKQEVRELSGYADGMRLNEIDDLLDKAKAWRVEAEGDKTLMQFLCHMQDKPEPDPKWQEPAAKPWYEPMIDELEGEYDVTRTRAYWEQVDRNKQARLRARPDSGPEFIEATLERLRRINAENNR
jgi:hypothetical protein